MEIGLVQAKPWDRQDLLLAFSLYTELTFGQLHHRNKKIIKYAQLMGRTASSLAMKLVNIASLDPVIISSGRKGLYRASKADRAMWHEMQENRLLFSTAMQDAVATIDTPVIPEYNEISANSFAVQETSQVSYLGETREATVQVRVGQAYFRAAVLSAYNNRCCISGLAVPQLLVASHIVPWRQDINQRLNPQNGLALSNLHDKAFDLGFLTIDEEYRVVVSEKVGATSDEFFVSALRNFHGKPMQLPNKYGLQAEFLAIHREQIFEKRLPNTHLTLTQPT